MATATWKYARATIAIALAGSSQNWAVLKRNGVFEVTTWSF